MIHVLASIHIKEGRLPDFIEIFKRNIPNVLQEEGCLGYVQTVDLVTDLPPQELASNVVTIIEKWQSLDALLTHLAAPHMLTYREDVKDLVVKVSLKILKEA
jgi:quinol monooxygenase YgiN